MLANQELTCNYGKSISAFYIGVLQEFVPQAPLIPAQRPFPPPEVDTGEGAVEKDAQSMALVLYFLLPAQSSRPRQLERAASYLASLKTRLLGS